MRFRPWHWIAGVAAGFGVASCAQILGIEPGEQLVGGGAGGVGGVGGSTSTTGGEGGAGACGAPCTGEPRWLKTYGGAYAQLATGLAVGASDGVTISGTFDEQIALDPVAGYVGTTGIEGFALRVDDDGVSTWGVFLTGDSSQPQATSLASRSDGGVVIAGFMSAEATFRGLSPVSGTVDIVGNVSGGDREMFVAAADAAGTPEWLTAANSSSGDQHAYAVAVAPNDNIYATGYYTGTPTISSLPPLPSANSDDDVLIVGLIPTGEIQWAVGFNGASADSGRGIAALSDNDAVVVGNYASTLTAGGHTLPDGEGGDVFVARVQFTTVVPWAVGLGGAGLEVVGAVTVDAEDNIYVTFVFADGPIELDGVDLELDPIGLVNVACVKLDADGALLAAHVIAGVDMNTATDMPVLEAPGLAIDAFGHIVVAGSFSGVLMVPGSDPHANIGPADSFLVKVDQDGAIVHNTLVQGTMANHEVKASAVAVAPNGDTFVTGSFIGGVSVGPFYVPGTGVTDDVFVARLAP